MLFKNSFRPAFAGVGTTPKQYMTNKKYDGAIFDSTQSNDFEAFSSRSTSGGYRPPKRPDRKTVTLEIPGRTIAIAIGAFVAFILLVSLVVSLFSSGNGNIAYENNAFACFEDTNGNYRVVMNGKVMNNEFENEVALTEAKDNSFAYVTTVVDNATNVYILEDGKLKLLCEKVDKVLALCDYEPGVIYKYGDKVEYSYNNLLTTLSKKNDSLPENFVISPDGSAVAYTIKNDSSLKDLYVYTENMSLPEARSKGDKTTIPVSISNGGKYIVAYTESEDTKKLYLITEDKSEYKQYEINGVAGNYHSVVSKNTDASELIFTTKQDKDYRTYVYNCTSIKKDITVAHLVSNGYAVPQNIDPLVCSVKTFKKSYFKDVTSPLTIYVNKKYERHEIYNYLGEIDPDSRYLYVIVEHKDNTLAQVELPGEKAGEVISNVSSIATDVTDFVITQKGNIYYIDGYGELYFYKLAKGKPTRIASDVTELTFYSYANELYFEKVNSVESNGVYTTAEGSDHKAFELAKTKLDSIIDLSNPYSKRSYTYYHNEENDKDILFYTANGNSFKKVAECNSIVSLHDDPLEKLVEDFLK